MLLGEWLERENLAAAQQRRIDREERVLRGRPDQDHDAALDIGQQDVLLRLVEAMDLVEEQDRSLAVHLQGVACGLEGFANVLGGRRDGIQSLKPALGVIGDHLGEGGFAGARGTVKNQRADAVGQEHPPKQLAGTNEVFLPRELVDRAGPHSGREGAGQPAILFSNIVKKVDDWLRW